MNRCRYIICGNSKFSQTAAVSLAVSHASLHCETTDTVLVYRAVCLFTPLLSLVLIAPTHGGMARLS